MILNGFACVPPCKLCREAEICSKTIEVPVERKAYVPKNRWKRVILECDHEVELFGAIHDGFGGKTRIMCETCNVFMNIKKIPKPKRSKKSEIPGQEECPF